jgi:drug/metabolite transporter (DMT)-like permease
MDSLVELLLAPVVLVGGVGPLPREVLVLTLASGLVHGLYGFFLIRAYESGELSVVYPVARSTPAFVPLVAVPLLGERLSVAGGLGILLVVAGIWLLIAAGPSFDWRRLLHPGAGFAYLTLATTVAYSLLDKRAMASLDAADWSGLLPRPVVFMVLIQVLYLPILALLAGRRRVGLEVLRHTWRRQGWRIVLGGFAGFTSYCLILEAMRTAPVSYVVAVRQMSVVFALVLGLLWLGERPSRLRVLGVFGTVLGVVLIALAPSGLE